jgi:DNA-binding XRE family transcriptional regulator
MTLTAWSPRRIVGGMARRKRKRRRKSAGADFTRTALSLFVKQMRTDAQLTQEGLAKLAGMSLRALAAIEIGEAKQPEVRTLVKLASALNTPAEDLFRLTA